MKTNYTDEQIQAAIDAACEETAKKHTVYLNALDITPNSSSWVSEAPVRRDLLKFALERLPEPAPPVVDGKTPGQVCWETWAVIPPVIEHGWNLIQNKEAWEQAASAVLAAFGQPSLEAAIARMEAVPINELWKIHERASNSLLSVRARLIAAARDDSQPAEADPPAWQPAVGDTPETDAFKRTVGEPWWDFARRLERERDESRASLSGRTVSCSQCNESARTIDQMRKVIREVYYDTETYADGAPDASAHDRVCNEVSSKLEPFLK
jgi:hypothetical protein